MDKSLNELTKRKPPNGAADPAIASAGGTPPSSSSRTPPPSHRENSAIDVLSSPEKGTHKSLLSGNNQKLLVTEFDTRPSCANDPPIRYEKRRGDALVPTGIRFRNATNHHKNGTAKQQTNSSPHYFRSRMPFWMQCCTMRYVLSVFIASISFEMSF